MYSNCLLLTRRGFLLQNLFSGSLLPFGTDEQTEGHDFKGKRNILRQNTPTQQWKHKSCGRFGQLNSKIWIMDPRMYFRTERFGESASVFISISHDTITYIFFLLICISLLIICYWRNVFILCVFVYYETN